MDVESITVLLSCVLSVLLFGFGEHQMSSQLRYESNDLYLQFRRELRPDLCRESR